MSSGDDLSFLLNRIDVYTNYNAINKKDLRRNIADEMIAQDKFPYSLYQWSLFKFINFKYLQLFLKIPS